MHAHLTGRTWKRGLLLAGLALLLGAGLILVVVFLRPTSGVGSAAPVGPTQEVANPADSSEAQRAAAPPQAEANPAVVATPATKSEEPTPVMTKKAPSKKPATQRKSNNLKKAAAAATCLELSAACTGAQVKPFTEEKCPPQALAAMAKLGIEEGDSGSLIIDIHQPGTQADDGSYRDGPVTSVLRGMDRDTLPSGTQLMGVLWTFSGRKSRSGLDVTYGRYTEAVTPDGRRYPICIILGDQDGVPQEETSRPGAVVLPRALPFTVVKRFVFE